MNVFNIERAYKDKIRRGWDVIYICIDVHDVILEGKYTVMNSGANYMPNSLNVLKKWSDKKDVKLILWSCSHDIPIVAVYDGLRSIGIEFDFINSNPECENTELCNFDRKFYFNILLEDKAGFEGQTDWFLIEDELKRIGQW